MTGQEKEYDVIVIGSGPSGRTVSIRSAKNGLSVVLIEDELVGGDCHYWACIPSKALLRPPEALDEAKEVEGSKQAVNNSLDSISVLKRRDDFVDHWQDGKLQATLEKAGVKILHGRGKLDGPRRVTIVDSSTRGIQTTLVARYAVVLSTGSRNAMPPIPGLAASAPWTNREATGSKKVPERLAILGGGPVAVEMATAWSSLGSKEITLIERGERILSKYEPFVAERLGQAFFEKGISVLTRTNIMEVRRISEGQEKGSLEITLHNGSKIISDELLVATGRKPNTEDLGLETIGLLSGSWLEVDDTCLVKGLAGSWLYAVGDANGRALLTHEGKYQARVCAASIAARINEAIPGDRGGQKSTRAPKMHEAIVPQVIFTDPQIATVGLTEQSARSKGMSVRTVDCEIGAIDGARLHKDGYKGQARIVVDENRQIIVGATLIGPQVGELIHAATVAIVGEVTLEKLWHAVPSFPTISELWVNLLEAYGL